MIQKKFTYKNINYSFSGIETDHVFKQIGLENHPFYEFAMLKFIQSLNIDGIYLDIGGNIGNHALFFTNHCPSEKVISFEPEDECFNILKTNMEANATKEYEIYNCGVWNEDTRLYLERFDSHSNMGMSKLVENNHGNNHKIFVIKLDGYIDISLKIGLIKIDTEGAELKVLQGAYEIIKKHKPVIICEAAEAKHKKALDEYLLQFGYARSVLKFNATPTYVWKIRGGFET